jgi:tRNA threonylcarbamoyladenosine biosynthesis protein TsaB
MTTLGIETSAVEGSIALVRDGVCLAERALSHTGRRHARELVVQMGELLGSAGLGPRDVNLVAVSIGPGSFTGLRVGVVCAKTFAYAVGCGVAAVDTFEAIAANSPPDVQRIEVVGDALRGDIYVGRYTRTAQGDWQRQGEIVVIPAEKWLTELGAETVVSGPAAEKFAADVVAESRLLPADLCVSRATTIALIGERQARRGELADVWSLEPVYVRQSGAEEKWDQHRSDDGRSPESKA